MILTHHDLEIELNDAWWNEASMAGFVASRRTYRVDLAAARGEPVFEARIDDVAPLRRDPGVGIFNTNDELTAKTHPMLTPLRIFVNY